MAAAPTVAERALEILRNEARPLRASEFARHGIGRVALFRLARNGVIERAGAGVYRLPDFTSVHADWAALSLRHPESLICTVSAASFHRTTQELPMAIHVAFPHGRGTAKATASFPVAVNPHYWRARRFPQAFTLGVEVHLIDNVPVRITDPERTLVDMFRFSSANPAMQDDLAHVDTETFLDCLRRTVSRPGFDAGRLDRYVEAAGVGREITPYLQTAYFAMSDFPSP